MKFTRSNKKQVVIKLVHKGELWYSFVRIIVIFKTVEQRSFFIIPYPAKTSTKQLIHIHKNELRQTNHPKRSQMQLCRLLKFIDYCNLFHLHATLSISIMLYRSKFDYQQGKNRYLSQTWAILSTFWNMT